jgi:hypothetical protein
MFLESLSKAAGLVMPGAAFEIAQVGCFLRRSDTTARCVHDLIEPGGHREFLIIREWSGPAGMGYVRPNAVS